MIQDSLELAFANTPGAVSSAKNDDKANCQMYVDPQQNVKAGKITLCVLCNSPIQLLGQQSQKPSGCSQGDINVHDTPAQMVLHVSDVLFATR
jgi:hypothetical protein